jgi:hypothetical protein
MNPQKSQAIQAGDNQRRVVLLMGEPAYILETLFRGGPIAQPHGDVHLCQFDSCKKRTGICRRCNSCGFFE